MLKKTLLSSGIVLATLALSACNEKEPVSVKKLDTAEHSVQYSHKDGEITSAKIEKTLIAEGVHYTVIENPIDRPSNEVLEFFWYGCSHCLSAEPHVKSWEKEANILGKYKLNAVHSNLNENWMFDSFVFYSLNSLGKEKEVHSAYFKARQDGTINSDQSVAAFFESYGVTMDQMKQEMERPEVIEYINKMQAIEVQAKSGGTPSFIVGGKYMVKLQGMDDFGGWSGLGEILNQLAEKSVTEAK